jgi:hypothetical protein
MTMPAPLPKPKVEVVQKFQTASPTIAAPTLQPCIVGPGFEILECLNADNTINSGAMAGNYAQLPLVINQSAFPAPRGNGAELNYLEETIRLFYLNGSQMVEHDRDPGDSMMSAMWMWLTSKPALESNALSLDGYDEVLNIGGKTLKFVLNNTVAIDESKDIIVTFDGGGGGGAGSLTPDEICEQVNAAAGKDVMSHYMKGSNHHLRLESDQYGATASVTVRDSGSANELLGFGWLGGGSPKGITQRVIGAGLRAEDDFDNDTATPWIGLYYGSYGDNQADSDEITEDTNYSSGGYTNLGAWPYWKLLLHDTPSLNDQLWAPVDSDDEDAAAVFGWDAFLAKNYSLAVSFYGYMGATPPETMVKPGDILYADGAQVGGAGVEVWKVEPYRIKLGRINPITSTPDGSGGYLTKVYDPVEVGTLFADLPFAPKYFYFRAQGLWYERTYSINEPATLPAPEATNVVAMPATALADWYLTLSGEVMLQGLRVKLATKNRTTNDWNDPVTKVITSGALVGITAVAEMLTELFDDPAISFGAVTDKSCVMVSGIDIPDTVTVDATACSIVIGVNGVAFAFDVDSDYYGDYEPDAFIDMLNSVFEDAGVQNMVKAGLNDGKLELWFKNSGTTEAEVADPVGTPLLGDTTGTVTFDGGSTTAVGVLYVQNPVDEDPDDGVVDHEGAKAGVRVLPESANSHLGFDTSAAPFVEGLGRDPEYSLSNLVVSDAVSFPLVIGADAPVHFTLVDDMGAHEFVGVIPAATYANIGNLITALTTNVKCTDDPWGPAAGTALMTFVASGNAVQLNLTSNGTLIIDDLAGVGLTSTGTAAVQFDSTGTETINGPNGDDLNLYLNHRNFLYTVKMNSNSVYQCARDINSAMHLGDGFTPIASVEASGTAFKLQLMSPLEGYGSFLNVVDWGDGNAAPAFGWDPTKESDNWAYGVGRPDPDFYLSFGNVVLGAEWLRDGLMGVPSANASASLYMNYKALRLDITPMAHDPQLQVYTQASIMMTEVDPITTENPFGFGCYCAKLNAPGIPVSGIGVHDISSAQPYGTPLGYMLSFEFLQAKDVYGVVPLTFEPTIHQMLKAHVDFMSEPEQMGERIGIFSAAMPTRATSTVVSSGMSANREQTDPEGVIALDTNPCAALMGAGVDDLLSIPVSKEVYVELSIATNAGSELRRYSLAAQNGIMSIFRTTFSSSENADGFYSVAPLVEQVINADWSMQIRGASLTLASGKRDLQRTAETVAQLYSPFQDRRMYYVFPDQFVMAPPTGGSDIVVPGFYMAAAVAGMVGQQSPSQPFTQLPIVGFKGVKGSSDIFTDAQLDQMAGGGAYIIIQESDGAPLVCRHQVSTDLTSIEKREMSITRAVDYTAKTMRTAVRPFIGRYNITQSLLDTLGTILQGTIGFLVDGGVLIAAKVNSIVQDATQRDRILIEITLSVPYPCNYIKITLVV